MYFVDREKIENRLAYLEKQLDIFRSKESWNHDIEKLALERLCHLSIEIILDVGNAMIDGFIMRDPGSYDDIIDILLDEKVILPEEGEGLKEVIALRKVLVQDYLEVDEQQLLQSFTKHLNVLAAFPLRVRTYIKKELGPVTAFKPIG
ncbi:DUF86 domain-containing protein [Metabacillus niabensis]|uniref:DUF86 domain-containing protein n=1 Tax=Metabacillus niabensis TaxID=324854 RepID=UPI00399F7F0F